MIAVLLAAGAAAGWGAADFFGGDASGRRTSVFVVIAVSELLGVALLAPLLIGTASSAPSLTETLLATVAGLAVTLELSLVYLALSRGEAFITAPVGALGAAVAVAIGLISGDPLNRLIAAGLLLALAGGGVSTWTSGASGGQTPPARTATIALGAAAAVGLMLTCFHAAGRADPVWVTAVEHASTALSAGLVAVASSRRCGRRIRPERSLLPALARLAVVGVAGDLAYAAASHDGSLSVVAAISSLYPITTILLGRLRQGRHASGTQLAGVSIALAGAVLLGAAAG